MDFEEQLEKAEKSPYPSLVGASVKSADDSPHNNYIHPEKYTGVPKQKNKKKSILNASIGASLDDLISEGALLGSEEDFDKFLDDKGNVLSDAKYTAKEKQPEKAVSADVSSSAAETSLAAETSQSGETEPHAVIPVVRGLKEDPNEPETDSASVLSPVESTEEKKENYSNPNLSEYQIGHQIADHSQLLDSVKSYDLSRLPSTDDTESRSKTSDFHGVERTARTARPNFARRNSAFANNKHEHAQNAQVLERDSLHSPYFQTNDERSPSRSRASLRERSIDRSRSRSRSSMSAAHLARGDTYKNTHGESPMKYELPADMLVDEEQEDEAEPERRSRQSRPTLGDSLAAVESDSVTKEPSLVTSGDYTNFNAERSDSLAYDSERPSARSESSRNYLRSISRSRSRKPASLHHEINEKNDSNTDELTREGALVSDDPYSQMGNLDNMMKQVLLASSERSREGEALKSKISRDSLKEPTSKEAVKQAEQSESKKEISESDPSKIQEKTPGIESSESKDKPAEPEIKIPEVVTIPPETSNNLITEPGADAVGEETELDAPISKPASKVADESSEPVKPVVDDVSAEEKVSEAEKQLNAEEAPKVSSSDITVDEKIAQKATQSETVLDAPKIETTDSPEVELPAEDLEKDAESQVRTTEAPVVTAADIKTGLETKEDEKEDEKEEKEEKEDEKDEKSEEKEKEEIAEDKEVGDEKAEETVEDEKIGEKSEETETEKDASEKDAEVTDSTTVVTGSDAIPSEEDSQVEKTLDEAAESPAEIEASSRDVDGKTTTESPKAEETTESPKNEVEATERLKDEADTNTPKEIEADPEAAATETEAAKKDVEKPETVTSTISSIAGAVFGAASNILPGQEVKKETAEEKTDDADDLDISPEELRKHLKSLPVYIFTSLAGGMQIVNRTNRLTTILQANKVQFQYRDLGTDEEAKKLWRRYAQGKTLPGVVRGDDFIGNWEYIEEVNEDYRLNEVLYETL